MRRKLFTLAAALSTVLCVGACVLWALSTRESFGPEWVIDSARRISVYAYDGGAYLDIARADPRAVSSVAIGVDHEVFGFGYSDDSASQRVGGPLWLAALITSAMPAAWVASLARLRRGNRRRLRGLCHTCGYDLRATPQRCPECGAVPAGGAAT